MSGRICDLRGKPWCRLPVSAKNATVVRKVQGSSGQSRDPFRALLSGMFAFLAVALLASLVLGYREFSTGLPPVQKLLDYNPPVATRVLAADGTTIGEFFIEKRYLTPIYKIPKTVQLAFLAAEDANFYRHYGLDPLGILRALVANVGSQETRQGGSTITQQVVKQLLLTPERSYERKIREAVLSLRLESELTKSQILALYLNQIYLGSGAYGVQAAAREYFDKDIGAVSLAQAALLAGLPQAPSRYSPIRNLPQAKARQAYVLRRMVEENFITTAEAQAAGDDSLGLQTADTTISPKGPAPWYVEHVRRLLLARYGSSGTYRLGLTVHTPLDLRMQTEAQAALAKGINATDARQGYRGPLRRLPRSEWQKLLPAKGTRRSSEPLPPHEARVEAVVISGPGKRTFPREGGLYVRWAGGYAMVPQTGMKWASRSPRRPKLGDVIELRVAQGPDGTPIFAVAPENGTQGALVAMSSQTGDVLALVGGNDNGDTEFDRALQARRQPGSAFKPLIFAAALDRGYTPVTLLDDAPVTFPDRPGKPWSPKNFTKRFYGPTTLREALTKSRNVPTVKLVHAMGLPYLLDYLPRFGFESRFAANLSLSLGTGATTLLELVRAYGVFSSSGALLEPRFITKITDQHGNVLEERPARSSRALTEITAYQMTTMLRGVVERGTGRRARLDRPAAGKTGTTNDQRDAWFVGFTPEIVAGVWVGYDRDKTLGNKETGGRVAAPIWRDFMKQALAGAPVRDFPVPAEVILVPVDAHTGARTRLGEKGSILEAFRRGTEPGRLGWTS